MAIRIEANGAGFYRKAAATQSEESKRTFLENLDGIIREEQRHIIQLKGFQKKL